MTTFTFIVHNVTRRPLRSLFTIVGLAVAVGSAIALVGVAQSFEREFVRLYHGRGVDLIVQRSGGLDQLNESLPESLAPKLAAWPQVAEVMTGLVDIIAFEEHDLFTVALNGWPAQAPWFRELTIIAGRRLQAEDRNHVMLGKLLAANIGANVGDTVPLYGESFRVVGLYESTGHLENNSAVVLLPELQRLTNREGKVSAVLLKLVDPRNAQATASVQRAVAELDARLVAQPTSEFLSALPHIKAARAMAWITSVIALAIGGVGMLNTMIMAVFERTREIGTLRAIGWRSGRVLRLILGESLVLSLAAYAVGAVLSLALVYGLSVLPSTSGFVGWNIPPLVFLQGLAVALGMGLAGAAYPAWWGSRLSPTLAMRSV